MGFLNDHPVLIALAVVASVYLAKVVSRTIRTRRLFRRMPGPPHSSIFGHLIAMGAVTQRLPKRVHPHVFAYHLTKEYDLPPVFYLDIEPVDRGMVVVLDPEAAERIAQDSGLLKHPRLAEALDPLMGAHNLITGEGTFWKKWRSIFNPAFSVQQLMAQVPAIVECAEMFIKNLDRHATSGQPFRMEEEATKVTIDVIGKVICDHDFQTLTTDNNFLDTMRRTLSWMPDTQNLNPFHWYHPLRPFYWKYYKSRMDRYVGKVLDERFSVREAKKQAKSRKKTGIDLALEAYLQENGQDVDARVASMDAEFRKIAINQLHALLFAGHDTTASTICYCYYLLGQNPEALAKIRQEFDDVFGAGMNATEQLKQDPYLINKCDYTLAVVKEALRLWTPASTVRIGRKDYFIKDPVTGNMLPTENLLVWIPSMSMHRDARYWPDPDTFKPERFFPENSEKLVPNAFRPFEKGPRNCIGQELALLELKVILALTIREFEVTSAFDAIKQLDLDGTLWATTKDFKGGTQECFGDPAYQVLLAAGKPREGMPARIKRRNMS